MSNERLILPVKPRHHQHRFLAGVLGCAAIVVVVWGFQMKTTFKKFATARQEQAAAAVDQSDAQVQFQAAAEALKEQISGWQAELQQEADKETAKQELLDKVAEGMKASIEAPPNPPLAGGAGGAGVVAGESTEAPAP